MKGNTRSVMLMVLKPEHLGRQITRTLKALHRGAGEGWGRSVGRIV